MLDKIKELVLSFTPENIELALTIGLNDLNISPIQLMSTVINTILDNKNICVIKDKDSTGTTIIRGINFKINGIYWSGSCFYHIKDSNDYLQEVLIETLKTLPRC